MATKSAAKPKTKKTTVKAAKKAAPARKKPAAKKTAATKKAATKATAKKAAPAKKAATKKAAPAKKTATKTAAKKAAPAKKTVKTAAKKATAKTTKATKATASKAAAVKKPVAKKATAAAKAAEAKLAMTPEPEAPAKPANVGQAPRKTTLAASIPVPTSPLGGGDVDPDAPIVQNTEAESTAKEDFKVNDKIVYPAHGVGEIIGLEKQEVAGIAIELFVIVFDQEKMKLRVPTGKAKSAGMRPLADDKTVKDAITLLKGRARIKRTMWSRRAQEYDAKINSGDIKLVAEVVRDLYRAEDQPEQSYSERQLFEAALDRMAREVAAVRKSDLGAAIEELDSVLKKKVAA